MVIIYQLSLYGFYVDVIYIDHYRTSNSMYAGNFVKGELKGKDG